MEMIRKSLSAVLTESVQKSLEKNRYGKAVTVNVSVEKDNSGKYGLFGYRDE